MIAYRLLSSSVFQTYSSQVEATPTDIIATVVLAAFALGFVVLGFLFLRKKRNEARKILTEASLEADKKHGLQDYVDGKKKPAELEAHREEQVPKADELKDAERQVAKTKAVEERAKRDLQRAEEDAAKKKAELEADTVRAAAEAEAKKNEAEKVQRELKEAAEKAKDEESQKAAAEEAEKARLDALAEAQKAKEEQEAAAKELADAEAKVADAKAAEERAAQDAENAKAHAKKLQSALSKTRDGFVGRIGKTLSGKKEIDDDLLDELEAVLFTADIGARTADRLLEAVKTKLKNNELSDPAKVTEVLKGEVRAILKATDSKPLEVSNETNVFMILGVNGAGKTTSIGKLGHQLRSNGKSVLFGAGDTFRAAAADQLKIWAERNDSPIVMSDKDGADPASVLFDATKKAKELKSDIVLCDTAGRLHTQVNLMEELKKVRRVLGKAVEGAPHEALLVLDATVGQNAIQQAKQFGDAVPLTGIILTKLDGTAKGGVVIGIADQLQIPVRYIGVGEQIEDLRAFDPDEFVDALFGEDTL